MSEVQMSSSVENNFKREFLRLLREGGLPAPKEWEASFPDFMPVVAKFIDVDKGRVFTVEENPHFEFACDYAIRKTGGDFQQFDLLLRFQDAYSSLGLALDVYRWWFIDLYSVSEMESYLSDMCE